MMQRRASEDLDARRARALRFQREAAKPPPPLPVKRMAHPGGKIVTGDKDACLRKLLLRKAANGEVLTADQRRALQTLSVQDGAAVVTPEATSRAQAPPLPSAQAATNAGEDFELVPSVNKRLRALRKKLREIAQLEERLAEGGVLQQNQKDKIAGKEAILHEISEIERES